MRGPNEKRYSDSASLSLQEQINVLQADVGQLNSLLTAIQTQVNAIQAKTDLVPDGTVAPIDAGVIPTLASITEDRQKINQIISALQTAGVLT